MPAVGGQKNDKIPPNAFRVLVTGFGPFMHYEENPSWLAVKPLQNALLYTNAEPDKNIFAPSSSSSASSPSSSLIRTTIPRPNSGPATPPAPPRPSTPRPIHITVLQIPVIYEKVLSIVPGLHARPPILPPDAPSDCAAPPSVSGGNNYDFMFHIGVAGRGPLRMERLGHKYGYHMKDASGKLAPLVRMKDYIRSSAEDEYDMAVGVGVSGSSGFSGSAHLSAAENMERERLGMDMVEVGVDAVLRPTRGFGHGYELFQEEYSSDIDVTRLVQDLKRSGVEQIYTSMDAGHYLCDFIYYCSLAEARRSRSAASGSSYPTSYQSTYSSATEPYDPHKKRIKTTQVLFLHCPPVGQPLGTEEVTDAIRKIVVWVCGEQQVQDEAEEAGLAVGDA